MLDYFPRLHACFHIYCKYGGIGVEQPEMLIQDEMLKPSLLEGRGGISLFNT